MKDKIRKRCPGCGIEKKLSEYHKDASKPYKVKTHCKSCRREQYAATCKQKRDGQA